MARKTTPLRKASTRKPTAPEWRIVTLRLPAVLVAEIDAIAARERRPRVRQIEVLLDDYARRDRIARES